jgi:integrase
VVKSEVSATLYLNRSTGFWYANVYWPETKTRKRYSLRVKTHKDALTAFEKFQVEVLPYLTNPNPATPPQRSCTAGTAGIPAGHSPSIRGLLDWYLTTYLPPRSKPKTIQKYAQILGDLSLYLSTRHMGSLSQISMRVLQEWLKWYDTHRPGRTSGRHSSRFTRDALAIVRAFINAALRNELLTESPIRYWDLPRKDKAPKWRALKLHELQECLDLIQTNSPSIANICRFLASSGWRVSDAIDLRWSEIERLPSPRLIRPIGPIRPTPFVIGSQIDRSQIKTRDHLNYPITPAIRQCLEIELARLDAPPHADDSVFHNAHGLPWTYNALYRRMTRALSSANFPRDVTPHVFRTTFATLAANNDPPMPPRILQNLLGHADIKMTLTYYTEVSLTDMARWNQALTAPIISPKTTENHVTPPNTPQKIRQSRK